MRTKAIFLALCATAAFAAEGAAPAPAHLPSGDAKALGKELESKLRTLRDAAIKDDAELAKLKTEVDDAKKRYETAVEAKLKDNADYQAIKAQIAELKGKKDGEKKDK